MGTLIVTAIAAVLYHFSIITKWVFIGIAAGSVLCMFINSYLYFKFGFLKFFYHDLLDWHRPDDSPQYSDGCSQHAKCKYCGRDIMQDSQGNWF